MCGYPAWASSMKNVRHFERPSAVIFDVDGTLYDHRRLKHRMLFELMHRLVRRPGFVRDIRILRLFRSQRELIAKSECSNLIDRQYGVVADIAEVQFDHVVKVVDYWLSEAPLKYLLGLKFDGVSEFVNMLKETGTKAAVYSEYPAAGKLRALGIEIDVVCCSTDPDIDSFKPDPKGLYVAAERLGVSLDDCLFIGDRDDKDGECARRAGMRYMLFNKSGPSDSYQFSSYKDLLALFKV